MICTGKLTGKLPA